MDHPSYNPDLTLGYFLLQYFLYLIPGPIFLAPEKMVDTSNAYFVDRLFKWKTVRKIAWQKCNFHR